jgi:putative membrane protein
MMYPYGNGHMTSAWDWFAMVITMMVVATVVVVTGLAAYRALSGRGESVPVPEPVRPDAESVLADRLARGEIGDDEYWSRLAVLRSGDEPDRRGRRLR